jgi:hypothetical protein
MEHNNKAGAENINGYSGHALLVDMLAIKHVGLFEVSKKPLFIGEAARLRRHTRRRPFTSPRTLSCKIDSENIASPWIYGENQCWSAMLACPRKIKIPPFSSTR